MLTKLIRILCVAFLFYTNTAHCEPLTLTINDTLDIPIEQFNADGDSLLIWLPSEAGLPATLRQTASILASRGVEVWLADLLEAHFLPVANSSMSKIPHTDVSELIEYARLKTGKTIYLTGSGRATIPLLHGAREWQLKYQQSVLFGGVILLSPKFYVETPDPGMPAQLLPVAEATNLPIHIIQPTDSPWRWKLAQTIPALEKNGSDASLQLIKDVRDRFYYRPDATATEKLKAARLPDMITSAIKLLKLDDRHPRAAVSKLEAPLNLTEGKKPRTLKPYPGSPAAYELSLNNLNEQAVDLKNYRNQVVLVNFWASWCPPCVHEMPSMQNLQRRFKSQGFEILAVNMAEEKATINTFLDEKVSVSFTILQDKDGEALKRWGVFAFPTSYIIGKQGRIRYALFGAVDWEDQDITEKIKYLLAE